MLQRTLTMPIYCTTIGIEKVRCDITEEVHIMATIQKRGDSYSIRVSCGYHQDKEVTENTEVSAGDNGYAQRVQGRAGYACSQMR